MTGRADPRRPPYLGPSAGCGLLFFGAFFCCGLSCFVLMLATMVWPEVRANYAYVEGRCTVLDKRLGESNGEDGPTYRPEVRIRYAAGGREHDVWTYDAAGVYSSGRADKQAIIDQFVAGREYPCWYDPDRPEKAVLARGLSWGMYLFLLIPLVFIAIGVGGVYHFWVNRHKTPEQRAAEAQQRRVVRAARDSASAPTDYPNVPEAPAAPPPGGTLAVRLTSEDAPGCVAAAIVVGALVLCGFVYGLFWLFGEKLRNEPVFMIAGTFATGILVVVIGYQLVKHVYFATRIGKTRVEVSALPLTVGEPAEVLVVQVGPMRLTEWRALLVCEEKAGYQQGTDTREEVRRVVEQVLDRREDFAIYRDELYEFRGPLRLPDDAMHSFTAAHNHVRWKLVVEGKAAGRPRFAWSYPLVVRPPRGRGAKA